MSGLWKWKGWKNEGKSKEPIKIWWFDRIFIVARHLRKSNYSTCMQGGLVMANFILDPRLGSSANPFLHRPFPFPPD